MLGADAPARAGRVGDRASAPTGGVPGGGDGRAEHPRHASPAAAGAERAAGVAHGGGGGGFPRRCDQDSALVFRRITAPIRVSVPSGGTPPAGLSLPDGIPLGFQTTFPGAYRHWARAAPRLCAAAELILATLAGDPRLRRLRHDERSARVGFGRAGFEVGRSGVVGDWRFGQAGDTYRARCGPPILPMRWISLPDGPPLLNGAAGFSVKAADPRHASYYSRPAVAGESGTVTLDGRSQAVVGRAWLDHEWSAK